MELLQSGKFYGQTNEKFSLAGLTLTDTEYTHEYVDWHYHEQAYFTFILQGRVIEGNKKETYHCTPGSLLFHQWQDAHYNIKPKGFTRGFHVELDAEWFERYDLKTSLLQGSFQLHHPQLQVIMYNIVKELKLDAENAKLAIDVLLIELFSAIGRTDKPPKSKKPEWVQQLRDLLFDTPADYKWTLSALSLQLNLHPVHLSRDFPKHFGISLGNYIRILKLTKALNLIAGSQHSLTDIALHCGFADQSHFIRSFKSIFKITPMAYRKLLA